MIDLKIYNPCVSVAVSSSAGSGKTHALTTRLLSMLLGGIKPEEILAITFTNAAAAEIRKKLFDRLRFIKEGDEEEVKLFCSILDIDPSGLLEKAGEVSEALIRRFSLLQISTIHSFLARVIRGFPLDTGIIDLRVVDEFVQKGFIDRAVDDFYRLLSGDWGLFERVYRFIVNYRERAVITSGIIKGVYEEIASKYFLEKYLMQTLESGVEEAERQFIRAREDLTEGRGKKHAKTLVELISTGININENRNLHKFLESLRSFLISRNPGELLNLSPFVQYRERGLLNYLRKFVESLPVHQKERFFNAFEGIWSLLCTLATTQMNYYLHIWMEIYRLINEFYSLKKRSEDSIDFVDIEVLASGLLNRLKDFGFLEYRTDSSLKYILIDEFQDTSLLQWEALRPVVMNALLKGGTIFYVGDVKQSIYRWRGGDPYLFYRVCSELGIHSERLPYSYRQNSLLLDVVNGVFKKLGATMHPHYLYEEQCLPPSRQDNNRGYFKVERFTSKEAVLDAVLHELKSLERLGVLMKDVAILCRKNSELEEIEQRLGVEGIFPATAGKTKLLREWFIRDIVNLIRFVLYPEEELYLTSLLRNPMFRQSYERISALRGYDGGISLSSLRDYEPDLFDKIIELINISNYSTPSGFLQRAYEIMGVFEAHSESFEALSQFYELAYNFEASMNSITLYDFLRYLEESEEYIVMRGGKRDGPTLQTIHGAKGLEFHTVILPFLTQPFNYRLDGGLMFVLDGQGRVERSAIARKLYFHYYHSEAKELERIYEETDLRYKIDELNTLYVAMTRACENLIVFPLSVRNAKTIGDMLIGALELKTQGDEQAVFFEKGEVVPSVEKLDVGERIVFSGGMERVKSYPVTGSFPGKRRSFRGGDEGRIKKIKTYDADSIFIHRGIDDILEGSERFSDSLLMRAGKLRGILVHSALEEIRYLPVCEELLFYLLRKAISKEAGGFSREEKRLAFERAIVSLRSIVDDERLVGYFQEGAVPEVNILSKRYQNLIGRVDRVILGESVELLDFKTDTIFSDKHLRALVLQYEAQLQTYSDVFRDIFPDRKIIGSLYFTEVEYSKRLVTIFEGD